jgi:ATP-dependent DNA helicase DinG
MGLRREINQQFSDLFDAIESHVWGQAESVNDNVSATQETKMRLLPSHIADPNWQAAVVPLAKRLSTHVGQFSGIIQSVITRLKDMDSEEIKAKCGNVLHDLQALNTRLRDCASTLLSMTTEPCPEGRVRWIETHPHRIFPNVQLIDAKLSVAEDLQEGLFKQFDSITLCSATMTVSRNFHFLKTRLGIAADDKRQVIERIYDSPFDYNKQALLAIPTDLPEPTSPLFHDASSQFISQAVQASQGHALVLFTSYQALQQCYNQLQPELEQQKFSLMKQGDEGRYMLLERFRTTKRSVLFATYSFWEGVDIPGDALRCVIIVKLPFKVPSEPIIQARTEAITAAGGDAFSEYSLPLAIVKFKQGFGRLIRRDKDRGCILCLDTRLITKRYGNAFLNSLPESKRLFAASQEILDGMRQFYRQTHHFTTQG